MRQITAGVMGAGRIGTLHAESLLATSGVRLKSIVDPYADLGPWTSASITTGRDPDLILGDDEIEAVLVCSPTPTHADLIDAAAGAGKHIFCEKPIDLDPDRVRSTLATVERAGVKLQVGFNRRFDHSFSRVRGAVADGSVGDIHLIKITSRDPAPPPIDYVQSSGGIFVDMTIHDFDMVRFLSASEVAEVHAFGAVLVDPAIGRAGDADTAVTSLRLASGAFAVIENSRQAAFGYDQRVEVFGSRGGVEALNEVPAQVRLTTAGGTRTETPLYFFLERYKQSFVAELEAFFSSVREDCRPPVGGQDGLAALLIALAAQRSVAESRPVPVEASGSFPTGQVPCPPDP
jgi:myo-inositol 2-dehydrogenase/D-chiro-inositol 1-dehydrogenase